MIRLANVVKTYDDGRTTALAPLNLAVAKGEHVSITGRSGSGKSTLLNLLAGLDRPDTGDIWFDGEQVTQARQWTALRARQIGIVFQHYCLLADFTVRENIDIGMMPLEQAPARRRRLDELVETFDLARIASQFPPTLSGGERQRVAIARAIANRPALLLADEPTGNLNTEASRNIMDILTGLNAASDCTLIVVTHDPAVAARAARRIELRDGTVISDTDGARP